MTIEIAGDINGLNVERKVGHFLQFYLWYQENSYLFDRDAIPFDVSNSFSLAGNLLAMHYWQWDGYTLPIAPIQEAAKDYLNLFSYEAFKKMGKVEFTKQLVRVMKPFLYDTAQAATMEAAKNEGKTAVKWANLAVDLWKYYGQIH